MSGSGSFPETLAEQARALADRRFSSVELAHYYLDRIARLDPRLNSFISVCPELALAQATAADAQA